MLSFIKPNVFAWLFMPMILICLGCQDVSEKSDAEQAEQTGQEFDYAWLDERDGEKALKWVEEQNKKTIARLATDSRYMPLYEAFKTQPKNDGNDARHLVSGDWIYQKRKSLENPLGIWSRLREQDFAANNDNWESLLDLDAFAKQSGKNWILNPHRLYFSPSGERALLKFSDGGGDASIIREFDLKTKQFVENGFADKLRLTLVSWFDEDTLLITVALDESELLASKFPRVVRLWSRGEKLEDAPVVLDGYNKSVIVRPAEYGSNSSRRTAVSEMIGQSEANLHIFDDNKRLVKVDVPGEVAYWAQIGMYGIGDLWITSVNQDWQNGDQFIPAESVVSINLEQLLAQNGNPENCVEIIHTAKDGESLALGIPAVTSQEAFFELKKDVYSTIWRARPRADGQGWDISQIELPSSIGTAMLSWPGNFRSTTQLLEFESFLIPPTSLLISKGNTPQVIPGNNSNQEDVSDFITKQFFAKAKDGTSIPYFVVHRKDLKYSGDAPALMFGYGTGGITFGPSFDVPYIGRIHKHWMEAGGVFVSAHPRGGGEYGAKWHQAAMGHNRQVSYDDLHAISEDMVQRKITSKGKISPIGGSSGGQMASVLALQKPDLYGASIALVPLTDLLIEGNNPYAEEYGDISTPEGRAIVKTYSPFHMVTKDKSFPEIFLLTSTRDERVHPKHARKLAAKLIEQGHPVLFYETAEGGHGLSVDDDGRAHLRAMQLVYLQQKLMDRP